MLTVSIPVLNNWRLTKQCLTSLAQTTQGHRLEVFVVDNGSTDETTTSCPALGRELFKERFGYLRQERNINYGPASNLGARKGTGEFILFLNNDTIMLPGWLEPLMDAFEADSKLGAATPLLMYPGENGDVDRVQHLGVVFDPLFYPGHLYELFPADHPLVKRRRSYQSLTGAALMLPRKLFAETGGYHEEYINGGEDVDLTLQLLGKGYGLRCVTESRIYHLASQTPGRNDNEEYNGSILKRRCLDRICPDLHLHAKADGYELRLSKWMRPYLALPQRRRELVERRYGQQADADTLKEAVLREPLWHAGRARLVDLLDARGDHEAATREAFLLTRLERSPGAFEALQQKATRAGDRANLEYALAALQAHHPFDEVATKELAPSARFIAEFMDRIGEKALASLYGDWLKRHVPEG